jgi:hypothetical protein
VAQSYFVHAVYGIELTGNELEKVQQEVQSRLQTMREELGPAYFDEEEDVHIDNILNLINHQSEGLATGLRREYQVLTHAGIHYTGSHDLRPGVCSTDPETYLFGIGLYCFPLDDRVSQKFQEAADWLSWVEAEV